MRPTHRFAPSWPVRATCARTLLFGAFGFLSVAFLLSGCGSVKRAAASQLADTLAGGGGSYARDDDPELIRQAVPFSLKLMESVLEETPRHVGLLEATAAAYTQYAFAFVQSDADEKEGSDYGAAEALRERARRLYLRAHAYALRGLEVRHPGLGAALAKGTWAEMRVALQREDTGLLYWAAASLGGAISLAKDDPAQIARLPQVEALVDAALASDEAWGGGSLHSLLITFEMSRQNVAGDPRARALRHYQRAVELSRGVTAGPHVNYAEAVCVEAQDIAGFEEALGKALSVNLEASPEHRLENELMQRRARWLLGRKADLFLKGDH